MKSEFFGFVEGKTYRRRREFRGRILGSKYERSKYKGLLRGIYDKIRIFLDIIKR